MIDTITLGKIIKALREKSKLTQDELAEKINISTNHLSKVERGLTNINVIAFLKMVEVLSCKLEDFGITSQPTVENIKNRIINRILTNSEKRNLLYEKSMNFVDEICK